MRRRRLFITSLVVLAPSLVTAQDDPCDVRWPGRSYPLDHGCADMTLVDLDLDGRRDVLAVSSYVGDLVRARGLERGFGVSVTISLGAKQPGRMAVGDLNGDGAVDVAVTRIPDPLLTVAFGDGLGGFSAPTTSPGLASSRRPVLADLDLDGDLDLVVREHGSAGDLGVHTNDGTGAFTGPVKLPVGSPGFEPVAADVDGDGDLDLTVPQYSMKHCLVFRGDGGGGFTGPLKLWITQYVYGLAVTDVDDDGRPDYLACGGGWDRLSLHRNNGGFDFGPVQHFPSLEYPYLIDMDDVDGDGDLDVLMPSAAVHGVAVHRREGDGFLPFSVVETFTGSTFRLAAADVVGDATPDVVMLRGSGSLVQVFEGGGAGEWYGQRVFPLSDYGQVWAMTTADLDADGRLDLIGCTENEIDVALGVDGSAFSASKAYPAWLGLPVEVAAADFDGDGATDVVGAALLGDAQFLRGLGDGTLGPAVSIPSSGNAQSLSISDIDVDGDLDLVIGVHDATRMLLGNGTGAFSAPLPIPGAANGRLAAVADFDVNGAPDVAFSRWSPAGIGVVFDPGVTSTPSSVAVAWPTDLTALAVGDVNLDGAPDLVGAGGSNHDIVVVPGAGAAGLGTPAAIDTGALSWPSSVEVRDVNGDGVQDVVFCSASQGIGVLEGDGLGSLREPVFTATIDAGTHALGDLNGDGRCDAVAGGGDHRVTILFARSAWWATGGPGCPGAGGLTPALSIPACHDPSVQLGMQLTEAHGGALALVLIGTGTSPTPIGASLCWLHVSPVAALPVPLGGIGPGAGSAQLVFAVPPVALGLSFSMQAAVSDPYSMPGFTMTNALDFDLP